MHFSLFLLTCCLVVPVHLAWAHGRMVDPPARNTMWRYGFENPHNYDDDENFCGGITKQWTINGGKCGVCGDDFSQKSPRNHEMGGLFGNGIIVKSYNPGQVISVSIHLSANHKGYFEFRLCPYVDSKKEVTQKCLDDSLLSFANTSETRWHIPDDSSNQNYSATFRLKLPEGLMCKSCVLQWHWYTANFWGQCENGTGALGCGEQETYRNCADVAIGYHNLHGHNYMYRQHPYYNYFSKRKYPEVDSLH